MWFIGRMLAWHAQGLEPVPDTKTKRKGKTSLVKRKTKGRYSVTAPLSWCYQSLASQWREHRPQPFLGKVGCRLSQWLDLQFSTHC